VQHTPTPWGIVPGPHGFSLCGPEARDSVTEARHHFIADIRTVPDHLYLNGAERATGRYGETCANAALLLTAPKLYRAVLAALARLEGRYDDPHLKAHGPPRLGAAGVLQDIHAILERSLEALEKNHMTLVAAGKTHEAPGS